jgi:DNA polymerase sigma
VTGLWKPGSDVDFVILPRMDSQEKKCKAVKYLRTLTGVLRKTEMFSVLFIGSAKVPIIKVVDYCSGLKGDVSTFFKFIGFPNIISDIVGFDVRYC